MVTDHPGIFEEITRHGGKAIMSSKEHESGSDRIAEAVENMDADIIVNVQGDEPFVHGPTFENLVDSFKDDTVQVASIMKIFTDQSLVNNPNYVKVAVDLRMNSLFFSRNPLPYHRNKDIAVNYYEHIGVYAFRKDILLSFTSWPVTPSRMRKNRMPAIPRAWHSTEDGAHRTCRREDRCTGRPAEGRGIPAAVPRFLKQST